MIVKTDLELIQNYLFDASNYKSSECEAVYIPESYEELVELMKVANENKTPVTISGAGTGLVGGRVPQGGIVISLEKFNKILSFNNSLKTVKVQSFVTLNELQNFLKEYNLFYPPDPTERNCSIGGTIATNASGARTLKYGSTRNWIDAIKLILPNGEIFDLTRGQIISNALEFKFKTKMNNNFSFTLPDYQMPQVKNAAGYFIQPNMDLIDLFIGSEGTLGIILEADLKLLEIPDEIISLVIFFETFEDAYEFVLISRSENKSEEFELISPRALEFFDDKSLEFLSSKFPNVVNKKFAIWFEQEINYEINNNIKTKNESFSDGLTVKTGSRPILQDSSYKDKVLEQLSNLILKCNGSLDDIWYAVNDKEINDIKEFRHSISALVNEYISRNNLRKVGTDIAVPSNYFKELYHFCCNECKKHSIEYVGYGHIGNDHLHFNMLPVDKEQNDLATKLYRDFCEKAIQMGGTISAEHGIGKLKRQYFELMYPENTLREMFRIKKIFDPNMILNRGNIFPEKFYNQ